MGCRRLLQFRVLAQDRLLGPLQVRAWLDAQLIGQQAARAAVRTQRVALPPGSVQGHHELPVERLMVGVAGDQGLQLRDKVLSLAQLEVSVDPPLQGKQVLVG